MQQESNIYIARAIEEILRPTMANTIQYLEVNEVALENGLPRVARVDLDYSEGLVAVFFSIKDEGYFLEIHLVRLPNIAIHGVHITSGNKIYLTATSETMSYDELSRFLSLAPLTGWSKGDLMNNGKRRYAFSRISFDPIPNEAYDLEQKLDLLLTELEKDTEGVQRLSHAAIAYISVCKHQYVDGNAGVHFDIRTINRLSRLNLSVDIDTYIGGNRMRGAE